MTVAELLAKFPRERTWLLPALQAVQRAQRYLSPDALETVAAHLRVPKSEVWGVASHYPELRLAPLGRRLVRVCAGVSCRVRGGREPPDALDALLTAPTPSHATVSTPPRVALPPAPTAGSPAARFAGLRREAERRRTGARLAVGMGTCGLAVGARETFEALRVEVQRRGLPFTVVASGCNGMCWAQPVVEVLRDGRPRLTTGPVAAAAVPRLLNALAANPAAAPDVGAEWLPRQRRVLLERCGLANPGDIAAAIRHGT